MVNFYNTLCVILAEDCGEFHEGLKSEKIGRGIVVNFYNTHLVILTVNNGEFLQHTLSNFNGELR